MVPRELSFRGPGGSKTGKIAKLMSAEGLGLQEELKSYSSSASSTEFSMWRRAAEPDQRTLMSSDCGAPWQHCWTDEKMPFNESRTGLLRKRSHLHTRFASLQVRMRQLEGDRTLQTSSLESEDGLTAQLKREQAY